MKRALRSRGCTGWVLGAVFSLSLAAGAGALPFKVQGSVDFGGPGGDGSAITGDFEGILRFAPIAAAGVGARIGSEMAPLFMDEVVATDTSFAGRYFLAGGVASAISPSGQDGLALFDAGFGADFALTGAVRILIRDANNDDFNIWFGAMGEPGYLASPDTGGIQPAQQYRLMQYDHDGKRQLWVEAIPTPGTMALLATIGVMASRRRR